MTLVLKDPEAALDYSIDWGSEYLGADGLAASGWSVDPDEAPGLNIVSSSFGPLIATVEASGGVPGRLYRLTNQVTTAGGREDRRSIMVRVEKR